LARFEFSQDHLVSWQLAHQVFQWKWKATAEQASGRHLEGELVDTSEATVSDSLQVSALPEDAQHNLLCHQLSELLLLAEPHSGSILERQ
jgi:hypothetical protein